MFLNFSQSQPQRSYKKVLTKKKNVYGSYEDTSRHSTPTKAHLKYKQLTADVPGLTKSAEGISDLEEASKGQLRRVGNKTSQRGTDKRHSSSLVCTAAHYNWRSRSFNRKSIILSQ